MVPSAKALVLVVSPHLDEMDRAQVEAVPVGTNMPRLRAVGHREALLVNLQQFRVRVGTGVCGAHKPENTNEAVRKCPALSLNAMIGLASWQKGPLTTPHSPPESVEL